MKEIIAQLKQQGYTHIIKGAEGICAYISKNHRTYAKEIQKLDPETFKDVKSGIYDIDYFKTD